MRETSITNSILKHIRQQGGWAMKVHGDDSTKGKPDIIGCVDGLFVGIEVKRPGEKASALQKYELRLIREAGGIAGVAESLADAIHLIENHVRN